MKKLVSVLLSVLLIAAVFTGCSSGKGEKYSDSVLIIGYTESAAPFLEVSEDGKATGFYADLWDAIFESVKGDFKTYRFEKVEEGYALEDDGGFFDSNDKEYSASLLMGDVHKNSSTFNEDYSFTEPIVTNRVIAVTKKGGKISSYNDLKGANAVTAGDYAKEALNKNFAITSLCKSVKAAKLDEALSLLDSGKADVVVTDEFTFNPSGKAESYTVLAGELDRQEYVIACAKYSGWKDSINEAIYEYRSAEYNKNGDEFTPLVEKYFGYNASSFDYEPEVSK